MNISLSALFVPPENLVSRDEFGSPVPRQPAHLHKYSIRLNLVLTLTYGIPPEFRGGVHLFIYNRHTPSGQSVPSLSGHAIAYRWRSLPRVRRHGANKPQCSFERVLPWQVTMMDQIIFASLSHTHYWYEVGMLKVYRRIIIGQQQQKRFSRCKLLA